MLHEKLMYIQETAAEKVAKENWWTKATKFEAACIVQYLKIHATASRAVVVQCHPFHSDSFLVKFVQPLF